MLGLGRRRMSPRWDMVSVDARGAQEPLVDEDLGWVLDGGMCGGGYDSGHAVPSPEKSLQE